MLGAWVKGLVDGNLLRDDIKVKENSYLNNILAERQTTMIRYQGWGMRNQMSTVGGSPLRMT